MSRAAVAGRAIAPRAAIGLVALAVVACSPAAPAAIQPTLAAISGLGYRCGTGVKDNVPSGLFQWSCAGTVSGATATILVDGNADGVAQITLVVNDPGDAVATVAEFDRLVDAAPPLDTAPVLKEAVAGWAGSQEAWTVGGVRISGQCDAIQCLLLVVGPGEPPRPLPLPRADAPVVGSAPRVPPLPLGRGAARADESRLSVIREGRWSRGRRHRLFVEASGGGQTAWGVELERHGPSATVPAGGVRAVLVGLVRHPDPHDSARQPPNGTGGAQWRMIPLCRGRCPMKMWPHDLAWVGGTWTTATTRSPDGTGTPRAEQLLRSSRWGRW